MRTLAFDCRMARMSGIGVYLCNVAPRCMALLADAVRFRLLGYDGAFPVPDGVSWEPVSFDAPIYSITEQYRMLPLLRGCDALWLPHYPIPVLAGIPLVVTVHDVTHLALPGLFTGIQKMYARLMFQAVRHKAAELLFVSEFSRQEFLRLVGRPRRGATVTPNGVDASWLECPLVDAPTQPPYFLAVGNIKPHKNIRLLCHTFAAIAGQCTANLVLAGAYTGFRSAETSTEALAAICPGRIHFTGALEQTELVHLMRGATALVFPSRYEGFGLPPLEALAVGVPVVASDIPPVREVCGTHAQYFSPDSEGQLAQAMLQVLALPPQERRQHAAAGRAHAHTFSWARAAETTAQVLQKTLHL